MASTFNLANFAANAIAANALNAATVFGGATLAIYSGTQPATADTALSGNTVLATFTLPAAGSNSVSSAGVITFGAITNVTAVATGTAVFARVTNGANTVCDMSVGTSSADCIINSTAISSGATVSISSMSYTVTH